jgi:hypothetical protein
VQDAHRHFSAACFNACWDEIDKPDRQSEETERMLLLASASLWHWTQREDHGPRELSIGHWQLSRVFALAGMAEPARFFASRCLADGEGGGLEPFFVAYAHEAMARAELAGGDREACRAQLELAFALTAQVAEAESRAMLEADLQQLQENSAG